MEEKKTFIKNFLKCSICMELMKSKILYFYFNKIYFRFLSNKLWSFFLWFFFFELLKNNLLLGKCILNNIRRNNNTCPICRKIIHNLQPK